MYKERIERERLAKLNPELAVPSGEEGPKEPTESSDQEYQNLLSAMHIEINEEEMEE